MNMRPKDRHTAPRQTWPSGFVRTSLEFVSSGCTGYVWPPILKATLISASQGIRHIEPRPSTDCSDAPDMPEYIALATSLRTTTIRTTPGERKTTLHVLRDLGQ